MRNSLWNIIFIYFKLTHHTQLRECRHGIFITYVRHDGFNFIIITQLDKHIAKLNFDPSVSVLIIEVQI